jgi:methyl-accepting chemotaxis protein
MILFSVVSGYFIWVWHTDQLEKQGHYYQKKYSEGLNMLKSYTTELERLLLMVEPKITEQVADAKELTEQEISVLVRRFSEMHKDIKQILESANQMADGQEAETLDQLRQSVGKVRNEIETVLEALQFQDRVSQILTMVQGNMATLRSAIENIQEQGSERHKKMLRTEEILSEIQTQYETVKHRNSRSSGKKPADDFTLF